MREPLHTSASAHLHVNTPVTFLAAGTVLRFGDASIGVDLFLPQNVVDRAAVVASIRAALDDAIWAGE